MEKALVGEIWVIPTFWIQEHWEVFADYNTFPVLQVVAELFWVLIKFVT